MRNLDNQVCPLLAVGSDTPHRPYRVHFELGELSRNGIHDKLHAFPPVETERLRIGVRQAG
jgi:hypothetical protein